MRATLRALAALAAFVAVMFGMLCRPAWADEPLTIRHGWVVMTGNLSPLIYAKPEIMKYEDKTYTVEPIHFGGTSPQITALAANEVDIASLAYSSLGNAVVNAHLDDLRIVADGFQDGAKGYASIEYMVRNDGGVKRVEDLKGKVMGVNVIGAAVDIGGRAVLLDHGLVADRDYSIIEGAFPAIGAMLLAGKADVVSLVAPFLYAPEIQKGAHKLFTMRDGMGTSQMIVLVAREGFLREHRAALDDFFEDMVRGIHWMYTPANRDAAIAFASKISKTPAEQLDSYFLTHKDSYRDPDGVPDLDALQRNIDAQVKFGFLKESFDVKKYADLSFIERAAQRFETAAR